MAYSELHRDNMDRIESDYMNLRAAFEMAEETLKEESEKYICVPALNPMIMMTIERLAVLERMVEKDPSLSAEEATVIMSQELIQILLHMYNTGLELGKRNYVLWSHVIDHKTDDEAEKILHRSWPT